MIACKWRTLCSASTKRPYKRCDKWKRTNSFVTNQLIRPRTKCINDFIFKLQAIERRVKKSTQQLDDKKQKVYALQRWRLTIIASVNLLKQKRRKGKQLAMLLVLYIINKLHAQLILLEESIKRIEKMCTVISSENFLEIESKCQIVTAGESLDALHCVVLWLVSLETIAIKCEKVYANMHFCTSAIFILKLRSVWYERTATSKFMANLYALLDLFGLFIWRHWFQGLWTAFEFFWCIPTSFFQILN